MAVIYLVWAETLGVTLTNAETSTESRTGEMDTCLGLI